MTTNNYTTSRDPNTGKVHRESRYRTQHYLLCNWRGVDYKLTGRFALDALKRVLSEYVPITGGSTRWGNEDAWLPDLFQPLPQHIWEETINWIPVKPKPSIVDTEDAAK